MLILLAHALLNTVAGLGLPNPLVFEPSTGALKLASASGALPILYDSGDPEAVHIAVATFAEDVLRVVGVKPELNAGVLPPGTTAAIIVGTVGSTLLKCVRDHAGDSFEIPHEQLPLAAPGLSTDDWEAFDARVISRPIDGIDEALVITGSDRRGTIYALYTLSEHMGVSPWYWWADVPPTQHETVAFRRDAVHAHGPPTVKYRGYFLNDEQPVLWNWAREHFHMGQKPPFQVEMYARMFELLLRLKGNYMWPAMWESMFAVDGLDGLPNPPKPGPNQELAERYGVVMGTSHHEPMSRNQKEFTTFGSGEWNFTTNVDFLRGFWRYGAERARECETVYTVGMRGDGDLPLDGADVHLLENITAEQQAILRKVHGEDISGIPQMWAMYKEVMGYFANGLEVPDEVTPLLSDDNWGNLMAVLPEDKEYKSGGGIYYHADYVGDPRDYKWINTVPLAKSKPPGDVADAVWEQLNVALAFKTDEIWILNVGDLKMLEVPLEYFLDMAYDAGRWPRISLEEYLSLRAERDFGAGKLAGEIADIMARYSVYASRRKAELVDSETFSLLNYDEGETVLGQWRDLEAHAKAIYDTLPGPYRIPFYELVYVQLQLQANLCRLYISAAKSNLYATQGRSAANYFAHDALLAFERDHQLTAEWDRLLGGKWKHAAWIKLSTEGGQIKGDGSADVRVWISVDWSAAPQVDNITVEFSSSDAIMVVTVPLKHVKPPPDGWHGAVEGDGYVAIEAGSPSYLFAQGEFSWADIPYYGRTVSGLAVFPVSSREFEPGLGPRARYDFWATSSGEVEIILYLGPALNFILGRRLALAIQVDDGEIRTIYPVPEAEAGSLPHDWEGVVADEVRKVSIRAQVGKPGAHSVTVYGVTAGIVLERLIIDFGGVKARGYSYLGPPASTIV
ncbi:uncharacterized protein CcaverHIS019_0511580 [Cutaneotrichosporon cavernicola]|uniref:Gylcosyl hydrolase 115 C-terminal domain-containing protein n=1 Tax=Cutaneotrichosporon cavernicola TaxID=279322 RepID=A0AA48L7V8_9TREE|nr:uncharacterized protein CcaverHIS019_0511580 [Cutaneotrichosporon cavernicola]BEI93530.1 hypothetical protein CcaverHIS019_0511580 [Cutaneotrichosporon cavernicola]